MSLMSLLLALVPPLGARLKPKPDRLAEALEAALARAREEITELRRERDLWRDRAYGAVPARAIPLRSQQLAQRISLLAQYQAQYQQAALQQAQYQAQMQQSQSLALQNAQMAQQSQNSPQYLLGAQNLSVLDQMFCNCVPARHDLLLG